MSTPSPALIGRPPSPLPQSARRVRVLPPHKDAASTARHFGRDCLQELGLPKEFHDDVANVVTELVANAVAHGATGGAPLSVEAGAVARSALPVLISFGLVPRALLVEVKDSSPMPPQPREPDLLHEGGRGLLLVGALASQWGWYALGAGAGKVVWATFVCPAPERDGPHTQTTG